MKALRILGIVTGIVVALIAVGIGMNAWGVWWFLNPIFFN